MKQDSFKAIKCVQNIRLHEPQFSSSFHGLFHLFQIDLYSKGVLCHWGRRQWSNRIRKWLGYNRLNLTNQLQPFVTEEPFAKYACRFCRPLHVDFVGLCNNLDLCHCICISYLLCVLSRVNTLSARVTTSWPVHCTLFSCKSMF